MVVKNVDVKEVRTAQIQNLKKFGYQLNKKFIPLPDEERLRLGLAILVDYETDTAIQCRKLKIRNCLSNYYQDLYPKPKERWGWIYGVKGGEEVFGLSSDEAIGEFAKAKKRGLTIAEGLALYREKPSILREICVILSGSRHGELHYTVPDLHIYNGSVKLGSLSSGHGKGFWGAASTVLF